MENNQPKAVHIKVAKVTLSDKDGTHLWCLYDNEDNKPISGWMNKENIQALIKVLNLCNS